LWDARFTIVGRMFHKRGTHVPQLWDEECPVTKVILSPYIVPKSPNVFDKFALAGKSAYRYVARFVLMEYLIQQFLHQVGVG